MLVSLKVIGGEEIDKLFGYKSKDEALNRLQVSMKQTIAETKGSLNLGNKFHGWMFGIQRQYILEMNDFKAKFN